MSAWILFSLLFAGLLLLQALFSGYETGFVSSNRIRIKYLADEEGRAGANVLLNHLENPNRMLTTLLIGSNICMTAGTLALLHDMENPIYTAAAAIPLYLVLAELIPKSVFRKHPNRLSLSFLPLIRFFQAILAPIVLPATAMLALLLRVAGAKKQSISPLMASLDDMRILVDESAAHGAIAREEQRMIHSVIGLQERQANEIMVPRIDIQALPETATRGELLALFEKSGRTRIPIYRETIDSIIGVVHVYELILEKKTAALEASFARLIQPVLHVPDTMKAADLLKAMQRERQHIAIVTDEYGGTDGLITLEDIIEEIFGDIQDEHDREESAIQFVGMDAYVVDARTSLEELAQTLGLPIVDNEVETVGGWILRAAGRIPAQGQVIQTAGYKITVLESTNTHVAKVRLEILPEARKSDREEID